MSEQERPGGTSSSTWIIIGVIALVVGGGCLVTCLGVIGMGFALPMRQAQQQAVEAEGVRQQAVEAAKDAQAESAPAQPEMKVQTRPDGDVPDEPQKKNPEDATPDGTNEAPSQETGDGSESPKGEAGDVPK